MRADGRTRAAFLAGAATGVLCLGALLLLTRPASLRANSGVTGSSTSLRLRARQGQEVMPQGWQGQPPYAYVFYATDTQYLCNSLINAKRLRNLNISQQADIVIMHAADLQQGSGGATSETAHIMQQLRSLGVVLQPVDLIKQERGEATWRESLTKLRFFDLERYQRVIYMDADGLVWRNMDHLFLLPHARVAMPRAYWLARGEYSDQIVVLEPKAAMLPALVAEAERSGGFDMDVMTAIYRDSCLTLPNEYDVLTGAFRAEDHAKYADGDQRPWSAERMLQTAYYIHFSDWPLRKPWAVDAGSLEDKAPPCPGRCEDREAWLGLYRTFREESAVCELPGQL
ncbi:hypothetical protein N2152v2_003047 [Parachlorella kessleri]